MCLIVFAYKTHPDYKLILAANRDEFYDRPTQAAHWWDDYPELLGGRDLKAMGTWMCIDKQARFAAVTNYRDITNLRDDAKSRGDLPADFLKNGDSSRQYMNQVLKNAQAYNGFNLLSMDDEMIHVSNYESTLNVLEPGIYGLSNALLDTEWPKVVKAKQSFQTVINKSFTTDQLIQLMLDPVVATDEQLPKTGLPLDMERAVSAMCIRTPNYGTCCTTAITIDYEGNASFVEKSHPVGERKEGVVEQTFKVDS